MEIQNIYKDYSAKRQRGIYYTPEKTAKFMVSLIRKHITEESRILDPCVGEGIFVKYLLESGIKNHQIIAHDIDKEITKEIRQKYSIDVRLKDTILETTGFYDIIIGNPPYKSRRNNAYIKSHSLELKKLYGDIGLHNLYSLFTINAINHVNSDGLICFIVEDAFMTNRYYKNFRQFILDTCFIEHLILAPRKLFHIASADVTTVIVVLRKKESGLNDVDHMELDTKHQVSMIGRCLTEDEYLNPKRKQVINQLVFRKMPEFKFFVDVPEKIIELLTKTKDNFGSISKGGAGISTGNDKEYLKSKQEVYDNPDWVGFYKSGQRTPYYYETDIFINKEYKKNAELDKNFIVRNEQYFFKKGITCSSVGRRFTAAYLPDGNLFGVNANFFFDNEEDLLYNLGFLNSKLVTFICRKMLARSNIIATSFIKEIPYIFPSKEDKQLVCELVQKIITNLKQDKTSSIEVEQALIDEIIFKLYEIDKALQLEIIDFYDNILDRV